MGYPRRQFTFKVCMLLLHVSGNTVFLPSSTQLIYKYIQLQALYINIYLCYAVFSQVSITGDLKVNVKGQVKPKYFQHSAPKHLKRKEGVPLHQELIRKEVSCHEEYCQRNYLAGSKISLMLRKSVIPSSINCLCYNSIRVKALEKINSTVGHLLKTKS